MTPPRATRPVALATAKSGSLERANACIALSRSTVAT